MLLEQLDAVRLNKNSSPLHIKGEGIAAEMAKLDAERADEADVIPYQEESGSDRSGDVD